MAFAPNDALRSTEYIFVLMLEVKNCCNKLKCRNFCNKLIPIIFESYCNANFELIAYCNEVIITIF